MYESDIDWPVKSDLRAAAVSSVGWLDHRTACLAAGCCLMSGLPHCCHARHTCSLCGGTWIEIQASFLSESRRTAFQEILPRKTTKNTVNHCGDGVGSVVANHHGGSGNLMVVTTLLCPWCRTDIAWRCCSTCLLGHLCPSTRGFSNYCMLHSAYSPKSYLEL